MATEASTTAALVELGNLLRFEGYRFVAVTPETHRRVLARGEVSARSLRDVFGWSLPFSRNALPPRVFELLRASGMLRRTIQGFQSQVRFASLGDALFVHSAYPTTDSDSVFFGPDTYRFWAFVARSGVCAQRAVDIGCGTGAGGILGCGTLAPRFVLADISEKALAFARVNARLAGRESQVDLCISDVLSGVLGEVDLIIANPPYMRDELGRAYRDGGGRFGEELAVRIVQQSLARLAPGGTLLLYSGAPVVQGHDMLHDRLAPLLVDARCAWAYDEIDPDVFGEELERPAYSEVERIAAVGLRVTVSSSGGAGVA